MLRLVKALVGFIAAVVSVIAAAIELRKALNDFLREEPEEAQSEKRT